MNKVKLYTMFSLTSTSGAYSFRSFWVWNLLVTYANFKVTKMNCSEFRNFDIVFFQTRMRYKTLLSIN